MIHLDFKELSCTSSKEFVSSFKHMVLDEFDRHDYLLSSNNLIIRQVRKLETFYKAVDDDKVDATDLRESTKFLSNLLYTQFNRTKCIVLIDEYDGPIQKAIFKSGTDLVLIVDFIRINFNFFKIQLICGKSIDYSLYTRLGAVITTDANNIEHITFLDDHPFSKFYGFKEEEFTSLLIKRNMLDKLGNVKKNGMMDTM